MEISQFAWVKDFIRLVLSEWYSANLQLSALLTCNVIFDAYKISGWIFSSFCASFVYIVNILSCISVFSRQTAFESQAESRVN